jgi:hypothetical protein
MCLYYYHLNIIKNRGSWNRFHFVSSRDGKGISSADLVDAMKTYYNLDKSVGSILANTAVSTLSTNPEKTIDLDQLQQHGFIEHDASLVHDDTALDANWIVNQTLVEQMLNQRYKWVSRKNICASYPTHG